MPSSSWTQIGRHKIKLTNLEKVLFPDAEVVKAEVIQYYLAIAPHLLRHIKHRPLTFIRYPDGIEEESFYQKNKPQFAPEWLQTVKLGKSRPINYLMATDEASLVWFANMACIEFHQQSIRYPNLEQPDHFVIDLDPPEDMDFSSIIEIAQDFRVLLQKYDYTPFVKTSGKKGVHIVTPIRQEYSYDDIKNTLTKLATSFVKQNGAITTLNIRKEARQGKVFIDIVRNNTSQTTVCPYSLRATPQGTVSMPLEWDDLVDIKDGTAFTIRNVPSILKSQGDPWEGITGYACELHDHKRQHALSQMPEALADYTAKRDFDNTPEPVPDNSYIAPDSFVLQRHDASRLHYDLRLAENGVLRSWALPKGLPPAPGIRYLAIETEPHPLSYLSFEGVIPKGNYGAGTMTVVTTGSYTITKTKKNGFYFRLNSKSFETEYRIHLMQEKEWLIERVDPAQITVPDATIAPMLCTPERTPNSNIKFKYEVKWDGIRALIYISKDSTRILSRSGREIQGSFNELTEDAQNLSCTEAIVDGEIVALDEAGKPDFKSVVSRLNSSKSIKGHQSTSKIYFYAFDLLFVDGVKTTRLPLQRRRALLQQMVKPGGLFRFSESVDDGEALFKATAEAGLEGIVGKDQSSTYQPGSRSTSWIKIKHRHTITCRILGFTAGKGERENTFGALHISDATEQGAYLGKVGTGFNDKLMVELRELMETAGTTDSVPAIAGDVAEDSTWLVNPLFCEVEYASVTSSGTLREPVFLGLRRDL